MTWRKGDLYRFSARNTGLYEAHLWKAYYSHRWLAALVYLYRVLHSQFSLDAFSAAQAALWGIRAALAWKPRDNDPERVQQALVRFYSVLQEATGGSFDPRAAGKAEFTYWVVHRELDGQPGSPQLADSLAAIAAAVYGLPMERVRSAAWARARACDLVDAMTSGVRPATPGAWAEVENALREAYSLVQVEIAAESRSPASMSN